MVQEDEMLLISEVAQRTGISVNTLRHWARTDQLDEAERRTMPTGPAWFTTIRAAEKRRTANENKPGRPLRVRKTRG